MNFNDLKIFIDIYETGSLNQSAVNLGYAQSNLTARLKNLESEQATLFLSENIMGLSQQKMVINFTILQKRHLEI